MKKWFYIIVSCDVLESSDHAIEFISEDEIENLQNLNVLAMPGLSERTSVIVTELTTDGVKKRRDDIEEKLQKIFAQPD